MKVSIVPESIIERTLLTLKLLPDSLILTQTSSIVTNAILLSAKLGILDAINGKRNSIEISMTCKTNIIATKNLLKILCSCNLITKSDECYRYSRNIKNNELTYIISNLKFQNLLDDHIRKNFENYIKHGTSNNFHEELTNQDKKIYNIAMVSIANLCKNEITTIPIPKHARHMLDIGGGHGLYSKSLCEKHKNLKSVVLDICSIEENELAENIQFKTGNALTEDFGTGKWDIIILSNIIHHFTNNENFALFKKISESLSSEGIVIVVDFIRQSNTTKQHTMVLDLLFTLTSNSQTWNISNIENWSKNSGLQIRKTRWLKSILGLTQIIIKKI